MSISISISISYSACTEPSLHPRFSITGIELEKTLEDSPPVIRARIMAKPAEFLSLLEAVLNGEEGLLLVVDKTHSLARDFAPRDLVRLDAGKIRVAKAGLALRREALGALVAMSDAARSAGITLTAGSAYRSYADQESVYAHWVRTLGKTQADRESAEPGHSQHQLGTTIDFSPIDDSFAALPEAAWLSGNAWRFGFSLSYPDGYESITGYKYEPWHFRYIGKEAAELVEKYFDGLQFRFLEFYAAHGDYFYLKMKKQPVAFFRDAMGRKKCLQPQLARIIEDEEISYLRTSLFIGG